MIKEENLGRYFNNLRNILKYKLETLDYFEQVSRMQELEKIAFWRLFYEKPIFCFIRTILFLPTYIWKFLDRSYDKFYMIKLRNEIDVLRTEIKYIQKRRWTK